MPIFKSIKFVILTFACLGFSSFLLANDLDFDGPVCKESVDFPVYQRQIIAEGNDGNSSLAKLKAIALVSEGEEGALYYLAKRSCEGEHEDHYFSPNRYIKVEMAAADPDQQTKYMATRDYVCCRSFK